MSAVQTLHVLEYIVDIKSDHFAVQLHIACILHMYMSLLPLQSPESGMMLSRLRLTRNIWQLSCNSIGFHTYSSNLM